MSNRKRDPSLQQIDEWEQCFITAHTARLAEANLAPDEHDRELAEVKRIAVAAAQKMRDDYCARQGRS
jgi:hypothetical protein